MLRIVGVIDTGSRDLDASICHVTLGEMARITGSDEVAELTVKVRDPYQIDAVLARLKKSPAGPNQVLTWEQILPAHGIDAASDRAFMNLFVGIVIIVVVLGVASAQLTAILERRKEFAVLLALGMKATQVIRLVAFEAVALGLFGAAVGLLLGGPLVYYTSTQGIDFGALMEGELAVSGVLFDPVLYTEMGLWIVPRSLWVGMAAALAGVIYPAWYVLRTNPSAALGAREV
jgi:ABC-type lipoprotein release transport system permease subunit